MCEELHIVPVSDLANTTNFALAGAYYHLQIIYIIFEKPALQKYWGKDPSLSQEEREAFNFEISKFFWHLRAYFWELIATFDHLLQWTNKKYDLELAERSVTWRNIRKANPTNFSKEWEDLKKYLSQVYSSIWFQEISKYRNFAHRDTFFMEWEYDERNNLNPDAAFLPHIRRDQPYIPLKEHLLGYYTRTKEVVSNTIT